MARVLTKNDWANMSRDHQQQVRDVIQASISKIALYPFKEHADLHIFGLLVKRNGSMTCLNPRHTALDLVVNEPTILNASPRDMTLEHSALLSCSFWDILRGKPDIRIGFHMTGTLHEQYLPMQHHKVPEMELIEALEGKPIDPVYHSDKYVYVITSLLRCEGKCAVTRSETWNTRCDTDSKKVLLGFNGIKFKIHKGTLTHGLCANVHFP